MIDIPSGAIKISDAMVRDLQELGIRNSTIGGIIGCLCILLGFAFLFCIILPSYNKLHDDNISLSWKESDALSNKVLFFAIISIFLLAVGLSVVIACTLDLINWINNPFAMALQSLTVGGK